jgi:hypothetical protein
VAEAVGQARNQSEKELSYVVVTTRGLVKAKLTEKT